MMLSTTGVVHGRHGVCVVLGQILILELLVGWHSLVHELVDIEFA